MLHQEPGEKFALLERPTFPEQLRVRLPHKALKLNEIRRLGSIGARRAKLTPDVEIQH